MNRKFDASLVDNKETKVNVKAALVSFEQDGRNIIFAPALAVYGYGKDSSEALRSFETCLQEFLTYTLNKKTLFKELKRLGWEIRKAKKKYIAPSFSKMLSENNKLIDIIDNNNANISHRSIALPMI